MHIPLPPLPLHSTCSGGLKLLKVYVAYVSFSEHEICFLVSGFLTHERDHQDQVSGKPHEVQSL
jgi:hypothetical protein